MMYESLFVILTILGSAVGFSSPATKDLSSIPSRSFIELTDLNNNGVKQTLPSSFINNWPTWVLEQNGTLSRIPDEFDNKGYVTPTSIDELWQPIDLKRPDMKLALGLHIRQGQIRHAMPALDINYNEGLHRNRGMCSVPRAYAWVDFGSLGIMGDWDNLELKVASKKREDDDWIQLSVSSGDAISQAIERALMCLADAPDDFADGSHLIHIPLDSADAIEVPRINHEIQVTLNEKYNDEPDIEAGILQVVITASMSGSESEYLPDVYKGLYFDEAFQNPRYKAHKKRSEEKNTEL